jgi:PucR C-terminal helix-turn-helix domain
VERLRERREEIYEAVIHRAFSVAPPSGKELPGYVEALRGAIPSAVEHAFHAIEVGEERIGPTPAAIFVQAAASARSNVGLEVVMRRYAAGYSTISDFLHQEVRASGEGSIQGYSVLQRDLTALFDRFVAEVSETYRREQGHPLPSPRERRLERIRRLLAGDLVDAGGLDYPIEGFHLAVIVSGAEPETAAFALARRLDRRVLVGESSIGRCAVWLGGSHALDLDHLDAEVGPLARDGVRLCLGEPGAGLAGWRRTRRQAEASCLVAERGSASLVRYRDVALVAAAMRDPDLAYFLNATYVEPLGEDRTPLELTIRTVLEMNGNVTSAGAALGLARQTVASRIRVVEQRLERPLRSCAAQLETALRLAELEG